MTFLFGLLVSYNYRPTSSAAAVCRVRHSPAEVPSQALKSPEERIGILVAQQKSGFVQFNGAVFEVVMCQLTPGVFDQLLEGEFDVGEATHIRSAPAFQVMMVPSSVLTRIASSEDSTMLARNALPISGRLRLATFMRALQAKRGNA